MPKGAERALPSGAVTFVFTDIEGSTQLLRVLGERYPTLLDQHRAALRTAWERHRGVEVGTEGDAFFVAFESADDAVAATIDGQRALAEVRWIVDRPVHVRMGIHSGFARPHGDNYAALAVHQAARVVDAAHGGQILLSSDARRALRRTPADVEIESLGRFRIRDFAAPEELFQVRGAGLPVGHSVPRAVPADGHNLVTPPTPVLGREEDLAALDTLVGPSTVVTVIGPGGIGKTRVAIEHGRRHADAWPHGVWFVDLSSTTGGDHVYAAVAEAVGAKAVPGQETRLDVLDELGQRRLLLVLDNCEHLGPAPAELVRDLLDHCPGVGVLATSRSPLGLRHERIHRLGSLGTTDDDAPAVRLFLDRSGIGRDEVPLAEVRSLCEAVDGLPLAIEIAASRAAMLGTDVVLDRLGGSLSVIRSKDPTLPPRQRTLQAVLDWSFDLLDAPVRQLLRQLSVLRAGFDIEMVVSAVADDEVETLEMLFTLVEQSLLVRDDTEGTTRFRIPVTVRTHALGETAPSERVEAARAAGRAVLERLGPERSTDWSWVGAMGVELDNVRSIIDLVAGHDDELGQSLAWSIGHYHDRVNALATAASEIAHLLEVLESPTPQRVALLCLLASTSINHQRLDAAADLVARAEALHQRVGGPAWDDQCVAQSRADLATATGDPAAAADTCRRALAVATSTRSRCRLLSALGIAEAIAGESSSSIDAFREELRIEMDAGMHLYLQRTHSNLAEVLSRSGDAAGAAVHQLRALETARAHDDRVQTALSMLLAAQLCLDRRWAAEAVTLHTAGTRALAQTSFVLYGADQENYQRLLEDARRALDDDTFETARREGGTLDDVEAADRTARVLGELAGSRLTDRTGRTDRTVTAEGIRST